ncbi:hypothetical protein [Frankia sp. QA3]|uniref:hypothetical protein n=1 Tax=Frankia sp. QA3 TaxID=710111 RepID=UPI000269CA0D|nr:hypothetical protein [Frankia sp. QA3]EIV93789.1 hypothetical protein FraQA3DRAFT_3502 [Frankia sp. QA3]
MSAFYDGLVVGLELARAALPPEEATFFNRPMSEPELIEWLCFQAYYERRAAEFIGRWLADTPEDDAFVLLARQVQDEGRHYQLLMRALDRRGVTSLDRWRPEPEWEEWIDVWYPSGADTLERIAAHNITGEIGAANAFVALRPRLPADVTATLDAILPDERFHMRLGQTVIDRHCHDGDQRARVTARVRRTFELEQAGRAAYNRRMARLGLADTTPDAPTPPLA